MNKKIWVTCVMLFCVVYTNADSNLLPQVLKQATPDKSQFIELLKQNLNRAKKEKYECDRSKERVELGAKSLGIIVSLFFVWQFLEMPKGYWDFIKTVFFVTATTTFAGWMISDLFVPILKLFLESEQECPYVEILEEFIVQWPMYRNFVTEKQQKKFDELYVMYRKNNGKLLVPDYFAQGMLSELFLAVLEGEVMDGNGQQLLDVVLISNQ
ncbi:MAG: hypothetical protein H6679_03495 [Epsilonproteobacteria bacterium]|nr:hypothetical protein [Campylobacterota bacterium]